MKEMREQLKNLKASRQEINPRKEWVEKSREMLFSQIKNSIGNAPARASFASSMESFFKFFVPAQAYHVMKVSFVFFLAIGITVGGWIGGVSASHNCLPGDFCYNVKLAAEKTQVAMASVTGDTNKEVALHMEFASRRLDELHQVGTDHRVEALQGLKKSLASVGTTLQEVNVTDPQKAAEVAKDVSKQTSDIIRSLNDSNNAQVVVSVDTAKEIVDTTKVINDTGIQALEIAIAGENGNVTSDDLKAIVQDKVNLILDVGKTAQLAAHTAQDTIQNIVTSTPPLVAGLPEVALTETADLTTTTTRELDPVLTTTSSTSELLDQAATKADATVVQAQNVVNEVKELLSSNNVDQAIEKVKALNDVVAETKQQLVDAQQGVSGQVPVIVSTSTVQITNTNTSTITSSPTP